MNLKTAFIILLYLFTNPFNLTSQSEVGSILTSLYQATGFYASKQPVIKLSNHVPIAEYNREQQVIFISREVYELCGQMSVPRSDALSVIIGHELAHHFLENSGGFVSNYPTTSKEIEKLADVHGIFIAHLAGFNALKAAPEVFERIYDHFPIKNNNLYPHFKERLQTKDEVIKTVGQLIDIFKAGNYLTALGEYNFASACYRHITDRHFYFGKELHNNLGIVSALYALNIYEEDIDYYLFPLELDWQLRIDKPKLPHDSKASDSEKERIRKRYLEIAAQSFQIAHQLDPSYSTTQINLMCVYVMQNKYKEAEYIWETLSSQNLNSKLREQLALVLGIVYAESGREYEATEIWRSIASSSNEVIRYQARYNLDVLVDKRYSNAKSFICLAINSSLENSRPSNFYSPEIQLLDRIYLQIKRKSDASTFFRFNNKSTKEIIDLGINDLPRNHSLPTNLERKIQHKSQHYDILHSSFNRYFLTCKSSRQSFLVNENGQLVGEARIQ